MASVNSIKNGNAAGLAAVYALRHEFVAAADTLMDGAASPKKPYRLSVRLASAVLALAEEEGYVAAWGAMSRLVRNMPGVNQAVIDNAKKRANHLLQSEIRAGNAAWDKFCIRAIYYKRERKHIENAICLASLMLIAERKEATVLHKLVLEKDEAY